jgi:hypothetical protein
MKIKVGTLDIIFSGSFLIERGKQFEFVIPDKDELPMRLIIFLIDDKNEKHFTIRPRLIDTQTLELSLVNFDHKQVGGGGTTHPLNIGTLHDRQLYVAFYLSVLTDTVMPLFYYTFYLGEHQLKKEVQNG